MVALDILSGVTMSKDKPVYAFNMVNRRRPSRDIDQYLRGNVENKHGSAVSYQVAELCKLIRQIGNELDEIYTRLEEIDGGP